MDDGTTGINPLVLKRLRALEMTACYVYLYLERVAGCAPGEWFECSAKTLMDDLGISDKPMRKALRRLCDLEILEVDRAYNGKAKTSMRLVKYGSQPVDKSILVAVKSPALARGGFKLDTSDFEPKQQVRELVAVKSPAVDSKGAYVLGLDLDLSLGGSAEGGLDERFDLFWNLYPRRVAKLEAHKSFVKAIDKTNIATILDGVTRYAEYVNRPDGPTCAHASTWLNQERWTDTYPAPKRLVSQFAATRTAADYQGI